MMTENNKYPAGKIYFGADKANYALKLELKDKLEELGFLVIDLGVFEIEEMQDSAVLAREVAEKVLENQDACDDHDHSDVHGCKAVGILIGEFGVAMLTAVSQMKGLVPSLCNSIEMASMAKKKGANLLCIGLDSVSREQVEPIIKEFLS